MSPLPLSGLQRQTAALLRNGQPDEALALLAAAATEHPADCGLWILRARAALTARDEALSRQCFSRALELEPANAMALRHLAQFCERAGEFGQAADCLRRLLALAPADAALQLRLAAAHVAAKDDAAAEAALRLLLACDTPPARAHAMLAQLLSRAARPAEALAVLRAGTSANPGDATLWQLLGGMLAGSDADGTMAAYEQSRLLAAPRRAVALPLAALLEKAGRLDEAAAVLRQYCEAVPQDFLAGIAHARLQARRGDDAGAADSLTAALAASPGNAQAGDLLLGALVRAGRSEAARLHFAALRQASLEAGPPDLVTGLLHIEQVLGVARPTPKAWLDQGLLPMRSGWTEEQRYQWGRAVQGLFRRISVFHPQLWHEAERFSAGLDLKQRLRVADGEPGAMLLAVHAGSPVHALARLAASGLPYRIVVRAGDLIAAHGEHVVDAGGRDRHTALARLAAFLGRGDNIMLAGDGAVGPRSQGFTHEGRVYALAAGPQLLAYRSRCRVFLFTSVFEGNKLVTVLRRGPVAQPGMSLAEWQDTWLGFFSGECIRILHTAPENRYYHPRFSEQRISCRDLPAPDAAG